MDPFSRPAVIGEAAVRLWALAALLAGPCYIIWRVVVTLDGADPLAAGLLLLSETLALLAFAMMVRSVSAPPIPLVTDRHTAMPYTAAVIDASRASIDDLRITLVAVGRVEGLGPVVVIDPAHARSVRTLADRFGAQVIDPNMTVVHCVSLSNRDWVLRLKAGDLPMPDLLNICAGACEDLNLAVLQLGFEEVDPDSYGYDPGHQRLLDAFHEQVARPSLGSRGSLPWFGDGPALIRPEPYRAALHAAPSAVDARVGLAMAETGHRVGHLPLTLARVRGPRTAGEAVAHRRAAAVSRIRVALAAEVRRLHRPERLAYLLGVLPVVRAAQYLLLVLVAILTLGLGRVPLAASPGQIFTIAIPAYLLTGGARLAVGRGRLRPFSALSRDLALLGTIPLVVLVGSLTAVLGVASSSVLTHSGNRGPANVALVAGVLVVGFIGVALRVQFDGLLRRRRVNQRVVLGLVTCRLQQIEGRLADLSTGGVGVVLHCPLHDAPEQDTTTTIGFRIPDSTGEWHNVAALVRIAHRSVASPTETRIGLAFDHPTDAPLDPVVEFVAVDLRLKSLGRAPSYPSEMYPLSPG